MSSDKDHYRPDSRPCALMSVNRASSYFAHGAKAFVAPRRERESPGLIDLGSTLPRRRQKKNSIQRTSFFRRISVLKCRSGISKSASGGEIKRAFSRAQTRLLAIRLTCARLAVPLWHHNGSPSLPRKEIKHLDKAGHSIVMNRFLSSWK